MGESERNKIDTAEVDEEEDVPGNHCKTSENYIKTRLQHPSMFITSHHITTYSWA